MTSRINSLTVYHVYSKCRLLCSIDHSMDYTVRCIVHSSQIKPTLYGSQIKSRNCNSVCFIFPCFACLQWLEKSEMQKGPSKRTSPTFRVVCSIDHSMHYTVRCIVIEFACIPCFYFHDLHGSFYLNLSFFLCNQENKIYR